MTIPTFNPIPRFSGLPRQCIGDWIQAIEAEASEQFEGLSADNARVTKEQFTLKLAADKSGGEVKRSISQFIHEESDPAWDTVKTRLMELYGGDD